MAGSADACRIFWICNQCGNIKRVAYATLLCFIILRPLTASSEFYNIFHRLLQGSRPQVLLRYSSRILRYKHILQHLLPPLKETE